MTDEFDPGIEGLTDFRRIGSGGFSTVYVAWEEAFSRRVAVKILDQLDEATGRRFARERTLMGQSSGHPNVITPIRFGLTTSDKPFLVMQFMEGGSLQDTVDRGELVPWRQAVALIRPIAEALGDSHDAGILHKDVKPANILLARNGTPSLTDFGIASARDATVTQMSFTFAHAPPETFSDDTDVRDERSDLYSLASTLHTIVAGRPPFIRGRDDSQLALLNRIAHHPVPPTGEDPLLDEFLSWAMAKDPAQRPQTAAEFVDGLDRVVAGDDLTSLRSLDTVIRSPLEHERSPAETVRPDEPPGPDLTASEGADGNRAGTEDDGWPESRVGRAASRRRWIDVAGWAVALLAVIGAGAAGWFAFGPDGPTDEASNGSPTSPGSAGEQEAVDPASPTSDPPSSSEAADGDGSIPPPEVQQARLLLQPGTDVATVIQTDVVLPSTSVSDGGFTPDNCESQLVGLQAAFGGAELTGLRDEIAQYPSGAPEGYTDPAGGDRGFRERLDAFIDQVDAGYRRCVDRVTITPVGPYVLAGWTSIRSFLCITGVVPAVPLPDGTDAQCPASDELDLCTRLLTPLLDEFFAAFPDVRPDPGASCQAAAANDEALLAELSGSS